MGVLADDKSSPFTDKLPTVSFFWQGAYVGAFAGYQEATDRLSSDELEYFRDEPFSPYAFDSEGFTGGVFVGASLQHGNVVLGLEGEIGSGTSQRESFADIENSDVDSVATDINAIARARVRAGYSFGRVLPYIAAGVSLADTSITMTNRNLIDDRTTQDDLYRVGFNAGAGVDVALGESFFARVEYVYDRFGSTGYGVPNIGDSAHFALDAHTVRAAVAYKFGGERGEPASVKDEPACCGVARWSGAYAGAFAGYQNTRTAWRSDETSPADDSEFAPIDLNGNGATGGAVFGLALQRGAVVAGVEADIGFADQSERIALNEDFDINSFKSEINATAHARVRVGYAFGNLQPFLAAGVALADTTVTIRDVDDRTPVASADVYRIGLTAGAGLDVLLGGNVFARVEYLYDRFGTAGAAPFLDGNAEYLDLELHTVRAALAYKMGGAPRNELGSAKDAHACCQASPSLWSGGYAGAFAGYQHAQDDWSSDETSPGEDQAFSPIAIRSDGFSGGGYVGASVQHGTLVLGVEGDIGSGGSQRKDLTDLGGSLDGVQSDIDWAAHARVRVGYAIGQIMPFVAAGVALAGTTVTLHDEDSDIAAESDELYRVGFTVGGGVDMQVAPNLVARIEYLYDQYAGANYGSTEHNSEFFELTTHTVRGGLALKFE